MWKKGSNRKFCPTVRQEHYYPRLASALFNIHTVYSTLYSNLKPFITKISSLRPTFLYQIICIGRLLPSSWALKNVHVLPQLNFLSPYIFPFSQKTHGSAHHDFGPQPILWIRKKEVENRRNLKAALRSRPISGMVWKNNLGPDQNVSTHARTHARPPNKSRDSGGFSTTWSAETVQGCRIR